MKLTKSHIVGGSGRGVSETGISNSWGWSRNERLTYLRDLLFMLVARDMKLRYKRSWVGVGWTLLNPLAQLLVFYFIFNAVLPLNVPHYSSFLFTGILVWNWFQSALLLATGAIVDHRELIKQPGFPAAILPIVTVTSNLIHFLLALPILFVFLMIDGSRLTIYSTVLPLVISIQFVLTLGLAYLVATFHVTFRDTQYLLGVILQLVFFLTPIFYNASVIPERYQTFYRLNPMVELTDAYRALLMRGELPNNLLALLFLGIIAIALLLLGYAIFKKASSDFVDEL
jgi:lipopolysaccharide transport system permease protein